MMFSDMLAMRVNPLSSVQPDPRQKGVRVVRPAQLKRHSNSLESYRKAMGDGWTSTTLIESRLGFVRGSVLGTLREWEQSGIVERRKVGGADNWCLRKGYEWRFC